MFRSLLLLACAAVTSAHFVINYPPDRGNSYNTQFQYPCGGLHSTGNRSAWPVNGGAVSIVPLHPFAFTTINLAIGTTIQETTDVNRWNHIMKATFNQTGGNGTFCVPKLSIPYALLPLVQDGVNATIQIVQLVASGQALYNCADIYFSATEAARFAQPDVWNAYCFNSSGMSANLLANADTLVNYTQLAIQELQLKEAAGSRTSATVTVMLAAVMVSIALLW